MFVADASEAIQIKTTGEWSLYDVFVVGFARITRTDTVELATDKSSYNRRQPSLSFVLIQVNKRVAEPIQSSRSLHRAIEYSVSPFAITVRVASLSLSFFPGLGSESTVRTAYERKKSKQTNCLLQLTFVSSNITCKAFDLSARNR